MQMVKAIYRMPDVAIVRHLFEVLNQERNALNASLSVIWLAIPSATTAPLPVGYLSPLKLLSFIDLSLKLSLLTCVIKRGQRKKTGFKKTVSVPGLLLGVFARKAK